MPRDLAADVNDNLWTAIEGLALEREDGEVRAFGALTAASSGLPLPLFNRVFAFDEPTPAELDAALEWMESRGLPYWVTAVPSTVDAVDADADDLGLEEASTQPGMAMHPIDDSPVSASGVDVTEVADREGLADFSAVSSTVFDMPRDVARQVDAAALRTDTVRSFLGRADGRPVACGTLIRTGDVAGVYTIGVIEEFRRRGLGEAMTRAVLRAGSEAGCEVAALQSSAMAEPLYRRMGFETVVTYHVFEPVG